VRTVLYDGRADSPTFGRYEVHNLTSASSGLLLIPPGVLHASQNWGEDEAAIMNVPTRPYDREAPDKFRLDPRSDEIPFDWSLPDR
jgi:dTDP-4-dehydrorhamnose 3,5-epimerase